MALKPCFQRLFKKDQVQKFPFTNEQVASIWKLAREMYIDKGIDLPEAIDRLSNDLGFNKELVGETKSTQFKGWIAKAFTEKKSLRSITEDMWNKMAARRIAVGQARALVADMDTPAWQKTVSTIYNAPRSLLIAGHGGVFPWTHMGQSLLVPSEWSNYFKAVGKSWSFMRPTEAGHAAWERDMLNAQFLPGWNVMRRVTPSIDREYTPVGIFGKYFGASRRAMDALKLARTEMGSKIYVQAGIDQLPYEQQLEAMRFIMRPIEHATGIFMGKGIVQRGWMSRLFFAPQLLPARWAASLTDPMRAIGTYGRWQSASVGERAAANFVARRTAQSIAATAGILALNEGINQLVGSEHHVNIKDPSQSDWLRLKVGGYNVPMSFTYEPIRLAIQMIASGHKPQRGEGTSQAFFRPFEQYTVSKLHPTIGKVVEGLYGRQMVTERPLPYAPVAPFFEPRKKEKPPVGVGEYAASIGPIPFGEGARELHHLLTEEGMSKEDATVWVRALAFAALGSVGPRPYPIKEPTTKKARQPF